jgi:hypothetical protein
VQPVKIVSVFITAGAPATTGEHGTKRSDLRDVFGAVAQGNPLFLHNSRQRNRRVGSLDAKALKLPAKLCAHCNNTRTQPHDLAWSAKPRRSGTINRYWAASFSISGKNSRWVCGQPRMPSTTGPSSTTT